MTTYKRLYANNAKTTVASPVGASDTSIIISDASKFPIPGANEFFLATLDNGTSIEIIEVHGVSGNVFTNCIRGCEGTNAQSFLTGTRVENRVTRDTLSSFARLIDRVADISSVDSLDTTANSPANSYLCASTDDGGTPILAVKNSSRWRFVNHPLKILAGDAAATGTANSMPLANANSVVPVTTAGSHIIQFTNGANAGLCRIIQSATSSALTWTGSLPNPVATADQYEIYESSAFTLGVVKNGSDDSLIFSILFGE